MKNLSLAILAVGFMWVATRWSQDSKPDAIFKALLILLALIAAIMAIVI